MIELRLPENGITEYSYKQEDFQYKSLINIEGIYLIPNSSKVSFWLGKITNGKKMECILQKDEQLVDIVTESVKKQGGRLLISGQENRSNSYYAKRYIYVIHSNYGIGVVDIKSQTHPERSIKVFCSNEINQNKRKRIEERIIKSFYKI